MRSVIGLASVLAVASLCCSEPEPHALTREHGDTSGPPVVVAIADRVHVRAMPEPNATVLGSLRAGAIVDRREEPVGFEGCPGGWYAIEPQGFVCRADNITLQRSHRIARALAPPDTAMPLPYRYARTHRGGAVAYSVLPSPWMQRSAEPYGHRESRRDTRPALLGMGANDVPLDEHGVPAGSPVIRLGSAGVGEDGYRTSDRFFEFSRTIPLEIGTQLVREPGARPVARAVMRAVGEGEVLRRGSGVALTGALDVGMGQARRRFGITPSGRFVPVDRLRPALGTTWHGVDTSNMGLPVGFAMRQGVQPRYLWRRSAALIADEEFSPREAIPLTGRFRTVNRIRYYETKQGSWVPHRDLIIIFARHKFPEFATGAQRWIDVALATQTLVAYEGRRPIYATLISSGRDRIGDPDEGPSTPQGIFRVREKHASREINSREVHHRHRLLEVPWVIDLADGPSLVGGYWLDYFGDARGHHHVALSPIDARFLFYWTAPELPKHWHSVVANPDDSTIVYIHK